MCGGEDPEEPKTSKSARGSCKTVRKGASAAKRSIVASKQRASTRRTLPQLEQAIKVSRTATAMQPIDPADRVNDWTQESEDRAFTRSFYGSSNGFRKGKVRQTSSIGSDMSRRGHNGSDESWRSWW
jgi:hypothetical protein